MSLLRRRSAQRDVTIELADKFLNDLRTQLDAAKAVIADLEGRIGEAEEEAQAR